MELKELSPELNELRNVILSSHLSSCYLILQHLGLSKDETYSYMKFKEEWIEMYKNTYKIIAKMKPRKSPR
jgi:hypothetical protein